MKVQFAVADPDDTEATLSITMRLKDWKGLRKQLASQYPSWKLSQAITDVIHHAQQHFYSEATDKEEAET